MKKRCALLLILGVLSFRIECAVPENETAVAVSDKSSFIAVSDKDPESGNDTAEEEQTPLLRKQTFPEAEKEIVDFINSLLRSILPKIVGGSGSSDLSSRCTAGMMKIFGNIRRLKGWTVKMLDSMGKTSPGILKGTSYTMGSYDECLDLSITSRGEETTNRSEEMFRGKYCRIRIQPREIVRETAEGYHKGAVNATDLRKLKDIVQIAPFMAVEMQYLNHFIGLCFPSICTDEDISHLAKLIPFPGLATVDRCEVKNDTIEIDKNQLVIICILFFLVLLTIVSTCIQWLVPSNDHNSLVADHDKRCVSVSLSFSICNNTKQLMKNIEEDVDGLLSGKPVRGIFVASVVWVIVGNAYLFPHKAFYMQSENLGNLGEYWDKAYFSIIQAYPLAVDALFVCFGFILTYSLWHSTSKSQKVRVSILGLLIKYYFRLVIATAFCLCVILLLPLFGSGPLWTDIVETSLERCKQSAWAYIGMYGNFLDLKDQCLPHLWFVPCLAQLLAVGILLCWILSKKMKLGVFIIFVLCTGCCTAVGISTYQNNFPLSYVSYFEKDAPSLFWKINMALPLSHFGPFAVGLLAGIFVARCENRTTGMLLDSLGTIASIGIICVLFSILYNFRDGSLGAYWSAVYAGLHRTVFGLCVVWWMIPNSSGIERFLKGIMSWRVFDPLYKLSLYVYIFHVIVIIYVVGTSRTHFSYSHQELVMRITFYTAVSYVLAYLFFILLEMPLLSLRDALCPGKVQQIDVTPLNNFKIPTANKISKNTIEGTCKLWSITETNMGDLK